VARWGTGLPPAARTWLWLERGTFLQRERDNWESKAVFVRGKYLAPEEWYDRHGQGFQPEVNYYVGGNTKFDAPLFRVRRRTSARSPSCRWSCT
jgi:hypothetical protein